jgi:hypothetical protein
MKESWGTLRLKRSQKEVARYACDCLRIMAELGVSKLAPQTIQGMTGLPYPTQGQKMQVQMQVQQSSQMGQQPNPQALQVLQSPTWEDLLNLLKDDVQRSFRIDIETNSTVDAEATEDTQHITELLQGISQFLSGVGPLVQSGAMPFEMMKSMLLAVVRRYRFGPELEDSLKAMQPPPQKPDPAMAKAQADMQMSQQDHQLTMQGKQFDMQAKQQELAAKAQSDQRAQALEERRMQLELDAMHQEHNIKMQEMAQKAAFAAAQHQQKLAQMAAQVAAAKAMPKAGGSKPA